MVTIYSSYDKKTLAELPVESYEGRIIVVLTEQDAEKAVDFLLAQPLLGVDTETRPSFKAGVHNKVALLQVSNGEVCFLFRLNQIGMCTAVKRFLEDTTVIKVGLSWHDDIRQLSTLGTFTPGNFVELQRKVGEIGIRDLGLQKVYANLFGKKLSKRQRLTNWEAPILTDAQKAYASLDALACVRIYKQMELLKDTHDYELIEVPVEQVQNPIRTPEEKAQARKERNRKKREQAKAKKKVATTAKKDTSAKKVGTAKKATTRKAAAKVVPAESVVELPAEAPVPTAVKAKKAPVRKTAAKTTKAASETTKAASKTTKATAKKATAKKATAKKATAKKATAEKAAAPKAPRKSSKKVEKTES